MKHDSGLGHDDRRQTQWHRDHGGGAEPTPAARLAGLALQTGIWASGCLAIATAAPAVLMAPLLSELLMMAAFAVSMVGLLRGERLSLSQFNRQDVALALIVLSLITGLFIDHAAVQHFVQQAQVAAAHAGAAATGAGAAATGAG